jgi:hypothetical protein
MFILKSYTIFKLKNTRMYASALLSLLFLTACPAKPETKAARELYQNKMNFDFKQHFKINYNGLKFHLPKKFETDQQISICSNGSACKSFSFSDLSLYIGISEIKEEELSSIKYVSKFPNSLDAVLYDAAFKRKESIYHVGRISESISFKCKLSCKLLTVTEPFQKSYSWEDDYSSLYYIAVIQKNNRYYVAQFCGKSDKMIYFLDDFKRILRSMN